MLLAYIVIPKLHIFSTEKRWLENFVPKREEEKLIKAEDNGL